MNDEKRKYYDLLSERFHCCIDCGYIGGEGKAPYCDDCKEYWRKLREAREEARANAIAQWNERSSIPAVPQEMSAKEYEKVKDRMRRSNGTDNAYGLYVRALFEGQIDEAVAIIEKWAREHPEEVKR